jgi:hypothetical protein
MAVPPIGSNVYKSELQAGEAAFAGYYSLSQLGPNPGFTSKFMVLWSDFQNMVNTITTNPNQQPYVAPGDLAIKFIHRFDDKKLVWFLTACLCQMAPPDINGNRAITEVPGQRYDLTNGLIVPSVFTGDYDPVYFSSLYYLISGNRTVMTPTVEAKWNVFPWNIEILKLYNDDFSTVTPGNPVNLVFDSCSFFCDLTLPNAFGSVNYPHSVAIYINNGGIDLLDDITPPASSMFLNKAADYASLCPPSGN